MRSNLSRGSFHSQALAARESVHERESLTEEKLPLNTVKVIEKVEKHEACPDLKKVNTNMSKSWDSKLYFTRVLKVSPHIQRNSNLM